MTDPNNIFNMSWESGITPNPITNNTPNMMAWGRIPSNTNGIFGSGNVLSDNQYNPHTFKPQEFGSILNKQYGPNTNGGMPTNPYSLEFGNNLGTWSLGLNAVTGLGKAIMGYKNYKLNKENSAHNRMMQQKQLDLALMDYKNQVDRDFRVNNQTLLKDSPVEYERLKLANRKAKLSLAS